MSSSTVPYAVKSARIRGFDGLRALAFLLVFISHKAPSPVRDRYGTAGVWIFFVLSGFLITRILADARGGIDAGESSFRSSLARFYARRTARIFPVYYVFLAVVTVAGLWNLVETGSAARQLSNWLYLSNIYIGLHGWETRLGHLWSLAVEEQFYLLFAPLALVCPLRRLHVVCLSIIGASLAAHAYLLFTGASDARFDTDSLVNFGLMAIGGLAGLWADRPLPRLLRGDGPLVVTLALILAMPVLFSSTAAWIHFARSTCVLNGLLLVQIYQLQNGRFTRLLDLYPIRQLGIISYAAYLFHPLINLSELANDLGYPVHSHRSWTMLADLAATIVLALASWRMLEQPVRKWLVALSEQRNCSVVNNG
ncbi:acyltransferase family protein [Bradyrhizobium roseum]|uniref:acyltransferase family protein n=1 Tax=Bradyrhizobium roseum TaxID=3056648 RepID=UPI00261061A7|nr:acyltransferase [Bradyrhizobium roseus]WKA30545.1 acyltransferase [Bradyrhizobium roseus]